MSNIKNYQVEHRPTSGGIEVEIDLDFTKKINTPNGEEDYTIEKLIKDMVEFWTGWEDKLEDNTGDYLDTFLKQLCREVITITAHNNLNHLGVIDYMEGEEGWCRLDGSCGIKLINVWDSDFTTQDDYEIIYK
jgi:hypothetical protein